MAKTEYPLGSVKTVEETLDLIQELDSLPKDSILILDTGQRWRKIYGPHWRRENSDRVSKTAVLAVLIKHKGGRVEC